MDTTGMEEVTAGEDRGRKRESEAGDRKTDCDGGRGEIGGQTEGQIEREKEIL